MCCRDSEQIICLLSSTLLWLHHGVEHCNAGVGRLYSCEFHYSLLWLSLLINKMSCNAYVLHHSVRSPQVHSQRNLGCRIFEQSLQTLLLFTNALKYSLCAIFLHIILNLGFRLETNLLKPSYSTSEKDNSCNTIILISSLRDTTWLNVQGPNATPSGVMIKAFN